MEAQYAVVCDFDGALEALGGCTGNAYLDLNGPEGDFSYPPPFCVLDLANAVDPERQQLCWFADDDRDDDGLADSDEDYNRNGFLDPGELDPNDFDSDDDCIPDRHARLRPPGPLRLRDRAGPLLHGPRVQPGHAGQGRRRQAPRVGL